MRIQLISSLFKLQGLRSSSKIDEKTEDEANVVVKSEDASNGVAAIDADNDPLAMDVNVWRGDHLQSSSLHEVVCPSLLIICYQQYIAVYI